MAWTPSRRIITYLAVAAVVSVLLPAIRPRTGELPVYVKAADRMVHGQEIYRPSDKKPFTYPPVFALPFILLMPLQAAVRTRVWYFVNLTLLGGVVALVLRRVWPMLHAGTGRPAPPPYLFFLVLGVLVARHLMSPVEYESHDLLVFFMVMLGIDAWAVGATWRTGSWVGVGAACKATPLLFLPVFLWQRHFRVAAAMVIVTAGATLLPDALFPRGDGELWVTAWYDTFISGFSAGSPAKAEGAWRSWNHLNQSLSGTMYRLLTPVPYVRADYVDVHIWHAGPNTVRMVVIVIQLAVLAVLAVATWPGHARGLTASEAAVQRLGQSGAVVSTMLLLSPMSSKQHFVVLLVPLAYCTADFLYRRRSPVVGGLLLLVFLVGSLTTKDLIGRPLGNQLLAYGSLTVCALALLVATAYVLVDRSTSVPREHP